MTSTEGSAVTQRTDGQTSTEGILEWTFYALAGVGILTALAYAFM